MPIKNPKLFIDPQIKYPSLTLSFSDYINECRNIIANTRQDLETDLRERIITANAPFELHPTTIKHGVLLIHGLLDSCYVMKEIATHLQANGLLARAVLLPGHGTVPGALLHMDYHKWLQTVRYGINSLTKEVDKILLVGYSTGALAAIYETLQNDTNIAGIISLAPAFQIKSPFACIANYPPLLGKKWLGGLQEENDYVKYSSITYHSVYQVYQLAQEVKKSLQTKKLNCPTFTVVSHDDEIISSAACLDYFRNDTHPKSRMIYYANPSIKLDDVRISVRNSYYPELRILNLSHICLPSSASNPHYGKEGDFCYASHVDRDRESYFYALDTLHTQIYRKFYQWKLIKNPRERLTFNPDFDFMMEKMCEFIFN